MSEGTSSPTLERKRVKQNRCQKHAGEARGPLRRAIFEPDSDFGYQAELRRCRYSAPKFQPLPTFDLSDHSKAGAEVTRSYLSLTAKWMRRHKGLQPPEVVAAAVPGMIGPDLPPNLK